MHPLAFHRTVTAIRHLFETEQVGFSLSDISLRAGVPLSQCAPAVATLVHEGVLRWDHDRNLVLRADDLQQPVTRRTA